MENIFIGNPQVVTFFKKILEEKSLVSTYLFSGPDSVGKKYFASLIAKSLLCKNEKLFGCNECTACHKIDKKIHPDFWIYEPENLMITIDQIRTLIQRLKLKPSESTYSIHIIDAVETMRIEAANAFLKITEEPPPFALILLITTVPDLLPATVRSRCFRIKFNRISCDEIYALLLQSKIPENKAHLMAHWADGSLAKALAMNFEHYSKLRATALQILLNMNRNLQSKNFPETLPPVFKRDRSAIEKLKEDFTLLTFFLSDLLRECLNAKTNAGIIHNYDIADEIKKLAQAVDINTLFFFMKLIEEVKEEYTVYHQNPLLLVQKLVINSVRA